MTEYTLGEICELKTGITFKTSDYTPSGIPVLRVGNIKNGVVVTNKLDYCDPKRFPKAVLISPGEVVISQMGSPGQVGFNDTKMDFLYTNVVIKCTSKNRAAASGGQGAGPVDNKFLYHWLRNSEPLMKSLIRGGVIPRINLEDLKKLKIKLPPLAVQKEIASQLDKFMSMGMAGVLREELSLRRQQYEYYRNLLVNPPVENYLTC